jgi:hypothetical protein
VLHVRVALHPHQLLYADGAELTDAPQIVTSQIHQHHVLGALFFVGQQAGGEGGVFLLVRTAGTSAGDGPVFEFALATANQHLGRRADQGLSTAPQQEHVGRGIEQAEGAIDGHWIRAGGATETLGEHCLVAIARQDMFFDLAHRGFE